jgi:hypothetical protein
VTRFPIVYHVMSHQIASISGDIVIQRHMMLVSTVQNRVEVHCKRTGDLVPFSPWRVPKGLSIQ